MMKPKTVGKTGRVIGVDMTPEMVVKARAMIRDWAPETDLADYVVSAAIEAVKPGG